MEFLKHIGEEDWPTSVMYRYDNNLIHFELVDGDPVVSMIKCRSLADVEDYKADYEDAVLLLEISESESGEPRSACARHTYMSSRNVLNLIVMKLMLSLLIIMPLISLKRWMISQ